MDSAAEVLAPDVDARAAWNLLSTRSVAGEPYLEARGLWPEVLIVAGVVRFTGAGDVCVALHDLNLGPAIVNVVRRILPRGGPRNLKVLGLRDCPTSGSLVGHLGQIRRGDDVVLCEGVVDSLAALCAWPGAVIVGAHGAGRMAELAAAVAPRVYQQDARLRIVNDADLTGIHAAAAAAREAIARGLRPGVDLLDTDLEGAHDLAAAWKAGWRP